MKTVSRFSTKKGFSPTKGKKAPLNTFLFAKGGSLSEVRKKPGSSNAGKYSKSEGPFCGPSGGAAAGTYPVGSIERGRSALKLAHNAPNPEGIKACVYRHYPELKPKAAKGMKLGQPKGKPGQGRGRGRGPGRGLCRGMSMSKFSKCSGGRLKP